MNKRKACFFGLAAMATLLAGCAAQYGNAGACVQAMRERLADSSQGTLSVDHRAVSYRGRRVVIEGTLEGVPLAASAAAAASGASAATAASAVTALPKPATPIAKLARKLGVTKPRHPPAAAECTFGDAGLVSFRWLAPAVLAKTTPAPAP